MDGFDKDFSTNVRLSFMQSDGGLCLMENFNGYRAVLSGPAGGVVGYVQTTYNQFNQRAIIGFDMGGTSTDVSRFDGEYELVFENTTAGVTIQAPQLDINTVAAGGGSILKFETGLYKVGPESVGAYPGPICYKRPNAKDLAVTDANLVLGRIVPAFFPKIFGENRDEQLGLIESKNAFGKMQNDINKYKEFMKLEKSTIPEIAMGFIKVANEAMCRPIRAITMARGYNAADHVLSCFGGAGGQHACAIARALSVHKVIVHGFAGILSAYGIRLADAVIGEQVHYGNLFTNENMIDINTRLKKLGVQAKEKLNKDGFLDKQIELTPYLNLRFKGTDTALFIPGSKLDIGGNDNTNDNENESKQLENVLNGYQKEFLQRYQRVE